VKRQTTLYTLGCGGFLIGLGLARWIVIPAGLIATVLFVLLLLGRRNRYLRTLLALAMCMLLGLWRGHAYMVRLADYQVLFRKPITIRATADNDAIYGKQSQLSFDVVSIVTASPTHQKLTGKIKVEGFGTPMVYRGDLLQIQGSLAPTKGSAQAKLSFATVKLVKRGHSPIDDVRRRFIAGLESVLPEPEAPFGAGLLLGQRSTIPKETNDQLSATGLTHLVAVSGYNLTIIIMAVRRVLSKASKFQSTIIAATLVLLFVIVTGLSASIVRAGLVSGLSLLAWYYGRQFKPLLLIIGTAALTTFWNPFYLWSDIGWYLSYLAFFGVLMLAPLLSKLISHGQTPKLVGALLAETVAAQIMTLPIIMYIFGRVSLIGLLANLLVVTLVPIAMLLTLLSGLAGMMYAPLGGWLAWPARTLLTYMIDLVGLLSRFPHASLQRSIGLNWMVGSYLAILAAMSILHWLLKSHQEANYVKITE
jgi:ComEC/Rec2-related protein